MKSQKGIIHLGLALAILILGIAAFVFVFAQQKLNVNEIAQTTQKQIQIKTCKVRGGTWKSWGDLGKQFCQYPAADANKQCNGGSECSLGKCISYDGSIPGKCQEFELTFGCYKFVENGQTEVGTCLD